MFPLIKDGGILHIIWEEEYFHFHADELLRTIIGNRIYCDGGVIVHSPDHSVHEAFLEPFFAFGETDTVKVERIAFHRGLTDIPVKGVVSPVDINSEQTVQFFKGSYAGGIKAVEPDILDGTKGSFYFGFCSTVSYRGVNFNDTKGSQG